VGAPRVWYAIRVPFEPEFADRRVTLLRGFGRAITNLRAARSLEDTLAVAAAEARNLLRAHVAIGRLDLALEGTLSRASLSEKYADLQDARASSGERLEAPVASEGGAPLGTIVVADPVAGSFSPADGEVLDHFAGILGMAVDSARVRPAALDAARVSDDIVAMVCHDLRSPLNTIAMSAGLMRQDAAGPPIALVERIEKSVARMNGLISDLIDASSIAQGPLSLVRVPERALPIVRDAVEAASVVAATHGCTIDCALSDDEMVILADRQRLMRALFHLLRNAVQFSPKGGSVTVRIDVDSGQFRFRVTDQGPGIAEDGIEHVFDRYRESNSLSRKRTGLGLFVSRGIVEAHGGQIRVESAKGNGTSVIVSIPLASAQ
jgi:signal transduction histidine kinase